MSQAELNHVYIYVILAVLLTVLILSTFIIWRQPQNQEITTFKVVFIKFFQFFKIIYFKWLKVPLIPFLPLLSAFANIYLMTTLSMATWYFKFGINLLKINEF